MIIGFILGLLVGVMAGAWLYRKYGNFPYKKL